jgi:hypothetical protein
MFTKFLILLTFPIACALAHESGSLNSLGESTPVPTIVQIATQQPEAIQHYDRIEKKLYLKTEKIFHTNAGLALYSGESVILLPRLSVDHRGYYLSCGHRRDDYHFTCPKPNCGTRWWFTETWSDLCPVCGTPGE